MGMKGNNFFHAIKYGTALLSQSIAAGATVNGPTISEPWSHGRQIAFTLNGGAVAANGSLAVKVQGLKRSDGTTWEALKEHDGVTDLQFTPTLLDDAGAIETSAILGTLDLGDLDGTTYKAIRLSFTENGGAGGGAFLIGAIYQIYDLYTHPSGTTDDLFAKVRANPAL